MTTSILCFLLLSAMLSLLVKADHQARDAADSVRVRDGDLKKSSPSAAEHRVSPLVY